MGKLITGIIVVFVLDLAFVLYLRSGTDFVELAQMPSSDLVLLGPQLEVPESTQVPPNESIYEVYQSPVASVSPTKAVRPSNSYRVRSVNNFETPLRKADRRPPKFKGPESFADTVIIAGHDGPVPNYQSYEPDIPGDAFSKTSVPDFEPKKRSPFMRVRSVVRKPYDWAKSFASKLF